MTITTIYAPVELPISGPGPYAFLFDVILPTDIFVSIDEVLISPGAYIVLLSGSSPIFSGGTVELINPPASGDLVIGRATVVDQQTLYQPFTPFPAKTTEFAFDKLTLLAQERGAVGVGSGGTPVNPTDPVFNTVTIRQPSPFLLLDAQDGQLMKLGSAATLANPGLQYSPDGGVVYINLITVSDLDDPSATGEVQIWGPTGIPGAVSTVYFNMAMDEHIHALKPINMDTNRIINLPTPTDAAEVATKGYADSIIGSGDTDPTFNSVTIQQAQPALILDDGAMGRFRFGADAGGGSPGISWSVDGGSTIYNALTVTDLTDPGGAGELQLYGGGNGESQITFDLRTSDTLVFKSLTMQNNTITGLPTPVDPDEAATKGYADSIIGSGDTDPDFNSVTITNATANLLLNDGATGRWKFGVDAGVGNPGIFGSTDNGATFFNSLTITDSTDPAGAGEMQLYGGADSVTTISFNLRIDDTLVYKDMDMQGNLLHNIADPVDSGDVVTLSFYNNTLAFTIDNLQHGNLEGLTDDDHAQYHTDARGDARYIQSSSLNPAGIVRAAATIVSDGSGSQSLSSSFGFSSCTISASKFFFTLTDPINVVKDMHIQVAVQSTIFTTVIATPFRDNSNTIQVLVESYNDSTDEWELITSNNLTFYIEVKNLGATS